MALVVIADLAIRSTDIEAHYTDEGVWPVKLVNLGWHFGYWSLHAVNGSLVWQVILFVLHFCAAFFLLVGWHTQRATFVTWLLLVSLQNRNIYILQGGDDLLRLVLLVGIMLPWNARFSLDARLGKVKDDYAPAAYLLYLLLIASVYLFSFLLKSSPEWRSEGSALYYALSLEQIRLPHSGDLLYRHPTILKYLTWMVIVIEAVIPLCILWPGAKGRGRLTGFFLVVLLHAGIASALYVGLFPFIGIATAIGLLPARRVPAIAAPESKPPGTYQLPATAVCTVLAAVMLVINLESLPAFNYRLHSLLRPAAAFFRLDQYWGMFSPSVLKKDGWFVYHGIDRHGREWDLYLDKGVVDYNKPKHIVSMYRNDRWRKLAENMQSDQFTFLRPQYARYVLQKWNREHPHHRMHTLNLYFMEKMNQAGYRSGKVTKVLYYTSDGR